MIISRSLKIKVALKKVAFIIKIYTVIAILSIGAYTITVGIISNKVTTYRYPHKEDVYLKMEGCKDRLVTVVDSIIKSTAPNSSLSGFEVVTKCIDSNIDIIFVLAQAKLESNFGTDGLAIKTNSVWNVGAYDNLKYAKIAGVYKYVHPNQSIQPYLDLLNRRYLANGKVELNLLEHYVDIDGRRYAKNPDYETKLTEIYNRYKVATSIYDKILEYNRYKLLYESY